MVPPQHAPGLPAVRQNLLALLRGRFLPADRAASEARLDGLAPRVRTQDLVEALSFALNEPPLQVARLLYKRAGKQAGDPSPEALAGRIRLRAWRTPPKDMGVLLCPRRLWGWLYKIAWRLLNDIREKRAPKTGIGPFASASSEDAQGAEPADRGPTPLEAFELSCVQETVRAAVAALKDPYLETFELRFFRGLEYEEIAERLGITCSAVRCRITRGLRLLKVELLRRGIDSAWAAA